MPEKPKRKRSPNRRIKILFFAIMLLCLVTSITSLSIYLLRPQGAKIVYLAPDKNGVEALWLADLANPENPKQLTHYEDPNTRIADYQITDDGQYIAYLLWSWETHTGAKIVLLDMQTK